MIRGPELREAKATVRRLEAGERKEEVEPTVRKAMTPARRLRIYLACQGRCVCGVKVPMENTVIDHRIPLWIGGADDDSNMRFVCRSCDKAKTSTDATVRGKIKRIHKTNNPELRSAAPKGRKLQSRGFNTTLTRTFSGKVKARKVRLGTDGNSTPGLDHDLT